MGAEITYSCDICDLVFDLGDLHAITFSMDLGTTYPIYMQRLLCHDCLKQRLIHFQSLGVTGGYLDILAAEPA